ncbi:hypothetical protein ONS95_001316 [Cadophora gregata]|uniref:uncharacterized protein n=1 Tax=Cadophora gregata TaxID=51156 RepID=UPI0026DC1C09|nr:uncharacterized protein ONS95_001316 [Cadophora gregata]KAK0129390.1 hypothetical protein ONS95_001316 [Cadophora gregata]
MTTIDEEAMDEFFNFDDAAHPLDVGIDPNAMDFSHLSDMAAGPYDIDLAFATQTDDENHFTCLQHFSAPEDHLSLHVNALPETGNGTETAMQDTTMMGPADFMDFPRWIDGMDVPARSCSYCQRMRLHCKVIKEGLRKGSCTSCVALDHSCSLTHPEASIKNNRGGGFCVPKTVNDTEDATPEACEHCFKQGMECKVIREGSHIGSCMDCVTYARECKARPKDFLSAWDLEELMELNQKNQSRQCHSSLPNSRSGSTGNLVSLRSSEENINAEFAEIAPKVGPRFSRESIRILRGWLSTHHAHPYPTDEEKESLIRQTGLNKTQITNWLANARRRGKVRPPRSTSPSVNNYSNAMDIPRRATPALENMNPLERWKNSPPENEPASVTAIAKAVTASTYSSGLASPSLSYGQTDDGSNRSICNVSSTSSLGTSHSSGGSFASAFSHKSRGSYGSFGSFGNRGRRRRRRQAPKPVTVNPAQGPPRAFQCTFCTETFKTKHDWQRHEKSLHLSLERWVCSPDGPTQYCADYGHNRCVYCGLSNPPLDHAEVHNHSSCAERSLEERTFYRKDHLRQHLNLVHDVKFQSFSMETWKVATPEIRSRCGFCGIVMDSWTIRVDHLAEHFKGGKSMADWKGDWGFEPQVLDIIENGMPPYLIHDERNSMNPFEATKEKTKDANEKSLEDYVKIGLVEYVHDAVLRGGVPTDADLLVEARKIVHKVDDVAFGKHPEGSWFRDLILLSGTTEEEMPERPGSPNYSCIKGVELVNAQVAPESAHVALSTCIKQRSLMKFVESKLALGLTPTDSELQAECCKILDDIEKQSSVQSKPAVAWFKFLINQSACWLRGFRRRAGLPRSSEILSEQIRSLDDKSIDYSIHNHARLVHELKDWVRFQVSLGTYPSDVELQNQARMIVFKNDDPWNQTAIDDPSILHQFKQQAGLVTMGDFASQGLNMPVLTEVSEGSQPSPKALHWDLDSTGMTLPSPGSGESTGSTHTPVDAPLHTLIQNQPSTNTNPTQPLKYFLNDANCYGRLARELTRFVTTCMSPNNPNQHLPSDAEIQNQARWVIYDDDDPWNQTAADNAEWLIRFKRDVGLSPSDGPGLPSSHPSWRIADGGTGFAPPFLMPQVLPPSDKFSTDIPVTIDHKTYNIKAKTAQKFVKGLSQRWQKPAQVFCSRDLESSLSAFVQAELAAGHCPTDDELRAKARTILGMENTAADDVELLRKFKAMHGITSTSIGLLGGGGMPMAVMDDEFLAEFDNELSGMDLTTVDFSGSNSLSHSHSNSNSNSNSSSGGASPEFSIPQMQQPQPISNLSAQLQSQSHSSSPSPPQFQTQNQTHSPNQSQPTLHQPTPRSKGDGPAIDYAELYRVHAATASPLRRRASAKMAARNGFVLGGGTGSVDRVGNGSASGSASGSGSGSGTLEGVGEEFVEEFGEGSGMLL